MKIAGLLLPLFIAANCALLRADETVKPPAPAGPAGLSPQPVQQSASVPPPDTPLAPVEARPVAPNPEVLELPKVTVTQKKRPRLTLTEEVLMTPKGFNEKLAKEKLGPLDRNVLNRFTLPSWTGAKSAAERAREEYERQKQEELINDVLHTAKVVEVVDPAQAKALRDAITKP